MKNERLEKYNLILKKAYEDFNKIKSENNNKLEALQDIIDKCNIIEEFNVEYLKELKKIKKQDDFKKSLEFYEESLSKEAIEKNFSDAKIQKVSAINKIKLFLSEMICLKDLANDEKYIKLKNIFDRFSEKIKNIEYKINCQILPLDNIELYLNILYRTIYIDFFETIKIFSYFKNYKDNKNKEFDKNKISEIEDMKKKML